MYILIVNDDGIYSPGLEALANALSRFGEITVVAPLGGHSGASRAITINTILQTEKIYKSGVFFGYAVGGTPVDCVKLALYDLVTQKPDYIFSGINLGANVSVNVNYSGTVAAAWEGALEGITSCAVSLATFNRESDFTTASAMAARWLEIMETGKLPKKILYNINVPPLPLDKIKGFAPAHLSNASISIEYEKRISPRGGHYYWLSGVEIPGSSDENGDIATLRRGYASVTPLFWADSTNHSVLNILQKSDLCIGL